MKKSTQNFEIYLPDSKQTLRDELITGDTANEIMQLLQRDFLFPDADGKVSGFPDNFSFVLERIDVSPGGTSPRLGRQVGKSEVSNFRVYGTRDVLAYLQRNGYFLYLPSAIAPDNEALMKVGVSNEDAGSG